VTSSGKPGGYKSEDETYNQAFLCHRPNSQEVPMAEESLFINRRNEMTQQTNNRVARGAESV
jgi:hypothetical protein